MKESFCLKNRVKGIEVVDRLSKAACPLLSALLGCAKLDTFICVKSCGAIWRSSQKENHWISNYSLCFYVLLVFVSHCCLGKMALRAGTANCLTQQFCC